MLTDKPLPAGRILRLFDANLNRAREGLRVVEDTARFMLCDERFYLELRSLRHRLDKATRAIYPDLVLNRNSAGDAGRNIKEGRRKDIRAILNANFRRVEESLRVLEEYSKVVKPGLSSVFKSVRFKTYMMEKKISGISFSKLVAN